jgi:hypothetical protein
MKTKIVTIATLWLLAILWCIMIFNISCGKDIDCHCGLTPQEEAIISFYHVGNITVFKNDMTGVFDTLHMTKMGGSLTNCSDPCENGYLSRDFHCDFSHLKECQVIVYQNTTPYISIEGTISLFELKGQFQTMTINGDNYNDVYVPSIDSTTIADSLRNSIPWKIAYSKSNGFIRFYMVNGQTWSKL